MNIGDRVGFMLANPPTPEDKRGLNRKRNGVENPVPTFADVLAEAGDTLDLIVWTVWGPEIIRGVAKDLAGASETWHPLGTIGAE